MQATSHTRHEKSVAKLAVVVDVMGRVSVASEPMTAPLPDALRNAESDFLTAQSESEPHRQGQYARSAADAAAEVSLDASASAQDRERAQTILRSAQSLIPGSLVRTARAKLTEARGETDPHRRRELARTAVAKAQEAVDRREVTDDERAEAREVIGGGRLIVNTVLESAMRQRATANTNPRVSPSDWRPARRSGPATWPRCVISTAWERTAGTRPTGKR